MSTKDVKYKQRVKNALDGYLHDNTFLNMLQKETVPNYECTEEELLVLYKINIIMCTAIKKLHLRGKLEKEFRKLNVAFENGELNESDIIKMIQDGNMERLKKFMGGGLNKYYRQTKKTKKTKKHKKRKKTLRKHQRMSKRIQRGGANNDECSICLDEMIDAEVVINGATTSTIVTTTCDHRFHRTCIDKWLIVATTCPVCRHILQVGPNYSQRRILLNIGASTIFLSVIDFSLGDSVPFVNNISFVTLCGMMAYMICQIIGPIIYNVIVQPNENDNEDNIEGPEL